jgi:hypothetical protein
MSLMKSIVVIIFSCLIFFRVSAQSDFVVAGGDASGPGGKISYSIGQVNFSYEKNQGSVSQGLQQPYEIFVISGGGVEGIDLEASAYPNPAFGSVTLRIDDGLIENLSYKLFDSLGRLIRSDEIVTKETLINLTVKSSATYILIVMKNKFEIKSFKIINGK